MWNKTHCLRVQSREPPKNSDIEKVSLDEYFKSFPCIKPPVHGLELVLILSVNFT